MSIWKIWILTLILFFWTPTASFPFGRGTLVGFGKFSGLTHGEVIDTQLSYCAWVKRTSFESNSSAARLKSWLLTVKTQKKKQRPQTPGTMHGPKIANVVGSSTDKPSSFGYSSWKEAWIASARRPWPSLCAYTDCDSRPILGGHIYVLGSRQKPHIVPMCLSCNCKRSRDYDGRYKGSSRHVAVDLGSPTSGMVDGKGYFAKRKTRGPRPPKGDNKSKSRREVTQKKKSTNKRAKKVIKTSFLPDGYSFTSWTKRDCDDVEF